jgi:hypothetical protein
LSRFYWRPLIPGERDPELLWGVVFLTTALTSAGWLELGLPTPLCPLHAVTGIPCPGCGMTRAARSLIQGDFRDAALFNPLFMTLLAGVAAYLVYAAVVVTLRLPRLRWEHVSRRTMFLLRVGVLLSIGLDWLYLMVREIRPL